jgi:hypothetical protein
VVVVTGNPDAEALRSRIEYTTRRPVTVVSDGGAGPLADVAHGAVSIRSTAADAGLLTVHHDGAFGCAAPVRPASATGLPVPRQPLVFTVGSRLGSVFC